MNNVAALSSAEQRIDISPASIRAFFSVTDGELPVLFLLLHGMSSKQIARQLDISPRTADKHRENLRHKLKSRTTRQMLALVRSLQKP